MQFSKTIFVQVILLLVLTLALPESAEAGGRRPRRKNNQVALKAKKKLKAKERARCASSARYAELGAVDGRFSYQTKSVDRRVNPSFGSYLTTISKGMKRSLVVSSGYRDCARNRKSGGASKSNHLTGNAVDVKGAAIAHYVHKAGIAKGQHLWNNRNNHAHLTIGGSGYFSESGGKGRYRRRSRRR